MNTLAEVRLWDSTIGAVLWNSENEFASFEYEPTFLLSGIEPSPIVMPLSENTYQFPALSRQSFRGLPGLLADSLPDKFGNALINTWLARSGRSPESFNPVERLCFTGSRGMGAIEYYPTTSPVGDTSNPLLVSELVQVAEEVLRDRTDFNTSLDPEGLSQLIQVGSSAGGARAKALVAWNPETNEVRSGQVETGSRFEYWLLKFDGVSENRDKELSYPKGFGAIEYAYYLMAIDAGISMTDCRLFEEGGRRHFMTRRFDRTRSGGKLHMQSLSALRHYDFNMAGAHSYEEALLTIRRLGLSMLDIEQQFRRMAFNIVARNQDDHVKNIAFLMDKSGTWSLSPAFDVVYSYNPAGDWTSRHQMTMAGKRDNFTLSDFDDCADSISMKRGQSQKILQEVCDIVADWAHYAGNASVEGTQITKIANTHRLRFDE